MTPPLCASSEERLGGLGEFPCPLRVVDPAFVLPRDLLLPRKIREFDMAVTGIGCGAGAKGLSVLFKPFGAMP